MPVKLKTHADRRRLKLHNYTVIAARLFWVGINGRTEKVIFPPIIPRIFDVRASSTLRTKRGANAFHTPDFPPR
jgi:hypothetical protein